MLTALRNVCTTIISVSSRTQLSPLTFTVSRHYADAPTGKKGAKLSAGARIKEFPVETDPHKLVNYVCGSNIYLEGEDVKLKPESEYPEWLWSIRTGPAPKLSELDPNTKEYWLKVRRLARQRKNKMHRLKYKVLKQF